MTTSTLSPGVVTVVTSVQIAGILPWSSGTITIEHFAPSAVSGCPPCAPVIIPSEPTTTLQLKFISTSNAARITKSNWTKSLRDGLPRLWHSDFLFYITKQWKASPKSSIVKSPQNNNQTGSTSPLPMKRIPPFHLVGKRFYDPNAPPYKAVFLITTDFIWRILLCMKNI